MISPSAGADRWAAAAGTASTRYLDGVNSTTKDPVALAIQAEGALLSNFSQAVQSGRWRNALSRAGKSGWQQGVRDKGVANFQTGVAAAKGKYQAAAGTWYPIIESIAQQVAGMPSGTPAANDQRMLFFANAMRQAKAAQG